MSPEVKKYIDQADEKRREKLNLLHDTITSLFPEITADMKYKMPTYHLRDGWVAFASQKSYLSLYTCGYHHIESFKDKHPKIKTGKGCINFKDKDPMPIEDIKDVIRHAILHPKP